MCDPGMSLSMSRPSYVVNVRTDPASVVTQCPRIMIKSLIGTDITDLICAVCSVKRCQVLPCDFSNVL